MRKIYKALTAEQRERGVIFSSTLSRARTEQAGDTIHEVKEDDPERGIEISRLKDDSFFNDGPWTYNIIRR